MKTIKLKHSIIAFLASLGTSVLLFFFAILLPAGFQAASEQESLTLLKTLEL